MNEPQSTAQPQKDVPPPSDSSDGSDSSASDDGKHPAQQPVGDNQGTQTGWEAAPAGPDLDNPEQHAKDDDATDSPNT
ncbi:MAG: hypothetical protein KY451_09915 [Actinobacteria bacterium]|nr:hypothetical protein [Actinomycetota bacterium]MBW3646329.1 hypothetical protein [Actinomycetota bacterium]